MTDEHETGSNNIVEVLHKCVKSLTSEGPLPKKLCLQLENWDRKNKTRYLLSYVGNLVIWDVYNEARVSFLPISHMNCDVDQSFSCTSARPRTHDVITPEAMHQQLRKCCNEFTAVHIMKNIAF